MDLQPSGPLAGSKPPPPAPRADPRPQDGRARQPLAGAHLPARLGPAELRVAGGRRCAGAAVSLPAQGGRRPLPGAPAPAENAGPRTAAPERGGDRHRRHQRAADSGGRAPMVRAGAHPDELHAVRASQARQLAPSPGRAARSGRAVTSRVPARRFWRGHDAAGGPGRAHRSRTGTVRAAAEPAGVVIRIVSCDLDHIAPGTQPLHFSRTFVGTQRRTAEQRCLSCCPGRSDGIDAGHCLFRILSCGSIRRLSVKQARRENVEYNTGEPKASSATLIRYSASLPKSSGIGSRQA